MTFFVNSWGGAIAAVEPGDFVVLPMRPPGGLAIEAAEWLQQFVQTHRIHLPQKYEHAEVYIGQPDSAGPYGYTYSTYPNRMGRRALAAPPDQLAGALWSSGVIDPTPGERNDILFWCASRPAVPYSVLDYLALTGHALGLDTSALQHYIQSQGHMICSQYVDAAFDAAGVHLFTDGRWNGYVTPLDLALLLESEGAVPQPIPQKL